MVFNLYCFHRSWGILSLTIAYCWQLYTLWILVQLHEAVPGKRYNRYVELAEAAFGENEFQHNFWLLNFSEHQKLWILPLLPQSWLSYSTSELTNTQMNIMAEHLLNSAWLFACILVLTCMDDINYHIHHINSDSDE